MFRFSYDNFYGDLQDYINRVANYKKDNYSFCLIPSEEINNLKMPEFIDLVILIDVGELTRVRFTHLYPVDNNVMYEMSTKLDEKYYYLIQQLLGNI